MKFNSSTLFPLTMIVLGVLIFIGNGNEMLSNRTQIILGSLQKPIGFIFAAIGFYLYTRSSK
jgi:hypothetical protein